jgi:hypothetical protein
LLTVLDEERVAELSAEVGHVWRNCFWRPAVVILTFLRQVLVPNTSCRAAVARTLADEGLAGRARRRPAGDPSAYSQARQRLPLELLQRLSRAVAAQLDAPPQRWRGHRVRVVDGSGVSAPDTAALQQAYPQSPSQKPGCGFPLIQMVGLFCWASGALLELVYAARHVGELQLFRRLRPHFEPGDVVVADRLYGTYAEIALLGQRGVAAVFRLHNARPADFRRGQRLGPDDRRVVWARPTKSPIGLAPELWATLPDTLTVRIVRRYTPDRRGVRRRRLVLVTTLLDAEAYPADELAELYRDRWRVELSLRSLKISQGMDVLRCRAPEMVHKELALHQIAYNLIRLLMREAATGYGVDLQRLSFAGASQRLRALLPHLPRGRGSVAWHRLLRLLLHDIAADRLPDRPGRKEPRALKRRHKVFPYLAHPRPVARTMAYYDGLA